MTLRKKCTAEFQIDLNHSLSIIPVRVLDTNSFNWSDFVKSSKRRKPKPLLTGIREQQEMSRDIKVIKSFLTTEIQMLILMLCFLLCSVNLKYVTDDKEMSTQIYNCVVYFLFMCRGLKTVWHNATAASVWSDSSLLSCLCIHVQVPPLALIPLDVQSRFLCPNSFNQAL